MLSESPVCEQVYIHLAVAVFIADKRYLKYQVIKRGRDLWMFPDSVDINNILTVCFFVFFLPLLVLNAWYSPLAS